MGVRRPRIENETLDVTKWFSFNGIDKGINLHRRDAYKQKKSLLYSKMRSIEKGTLKLPIPLKYLNKTTHTLTVELNGTLTYGYRKFNDKGHLIS